VEQHRYDAVGHIEIAEDYADQARHATAIEGASGDLSDKRVLLALLATAHATIAQAMAMGSLVALEGTDDEWPPARPWLARFGDEAGVDILAARRVAHQAAQQRRIDEEAARQAALADRTAAAADPTLGGPTHSPEARMVTVHLPVEEYRKLEDGAAYLDLPMERLSDIEPDVELRITGQGLGLALVRRVSYVAASVSVPPTGRLSHPLPEGHARVFLHPASGR